MKYNQSKKKLNAIDQDILQQNADMNKIKKSESFRSDKKVSVLIASKIETISQKSSILQKDDDEKKFIQQNKEKDSKNINYINQSFQKNQEAKGAGSCDMCSMF